MKEAEKEFNLQPTLADTLVKIVPLKEIDFEALFSVAADPLLWEQHPNRDRYLKPVFENFFKGAMESKGAFIIYDLASGEVIGSSRFYDKEKDAIAVGYTFIGRKYWGKGYNAAIKKLMFDYAFQYVDKIILHIGATNFRSQKAAEKIGAVKAGEINVAYYGEPVKVNFIYEVNKNQF